MSHKVEFTKVLPDDSIHMFVECFWMIENYTSESLEVSVLPDANFDLLLSKTNEKPMEIWLMGIGTKVDISKIEAHTKLYFINFKLFAAEYLFKRSIAGILNYAEQLPGNFWNFNERDILTFNHFVEKASILIKDLLPLEIDIRKEKLSEALYSSHGSESVKDLSDKAGWSSKQINRYFNQYFGLSLKTYCSILRFRASFTHLSQGKLYPEQNFADQAHFSREVKKLAGVNPKELTKYKNDRFIQVSLLGKK